MLAPVDGEIETVDHTADGTLVRGRVHAALAGELEAYLTHPSADLAPR